MKFNLKGVNIASPCHFFPSFLSSRIKGNEREEKKKKTMIDSACFYCSYMWCKIMLLIFESKKKDKTCLNIHELNIPPKKPS